MIKELKRILINPLSIFLIFGLFLVIFLFSYVYQSKIENSFNYREHPIEEYQSFNEIMDLIEVINSAIESLDTHDSNYTYQKKYLEETLSIYKYLYENEIDYFSYAETSHFFGYLNDPITFLLYLTPFVLTILIVTGLALAVSIVNYEQSTGVYKFIYGRENSRLRIIIRKLFAYFIIVFSIMFLMFLLMYILSLALNEPFEVIIILFNQTAYGFSVVNFIVMIFCSIMSVVVFYLIGFFAIALISKNTYVSISICIVFFGVFQMIFISLNFPVFQILSQFPIFLFELDYSLSYILLTIFLKYLLILVLLIYSIKSFCSRDI
ncbi:MAG: hypothetical protein Q7I99_05470 [Acholeplasmataceae bacterium]|nr:hypothetical protein [Acholeplasmataceae bacterium]